MASRQKGVLRAPGASNALPAKAFFNDLEETVNTESRYSRGYGELEQLFDRWRSKRRDRTASLTTSSFRKNDDVIFNVVWAVLMRFSRSPREQTERRIPSDHFKKN